MDLEKDLLELDVYLDMEEIDKIEKEFNNLMKQRDLSYKNQLLFYVSYNNSTESYSVKIKPSQEDFDSQRYFMACFGKEKDYGKLDKFCKLNNIKSITF